MNLTKLRLILKMNCDFCQNDLCHFLHIPFQDVLHMIKKQEIVGHLNEKFFIQELDNILNKKICTDLRLYFFDFIRTFENKL